MYRILRCCVLSIESLFYSEYCTFILKFVKVCAPQVVKALRETTGAGMMDCKRALVDAGGDVAVATEALRKKGLASAEKKVPPRG